MLQINMLLMEPLLPSTAVGMHSCALLFICSMFAVSCTFEFWPLNSDYGADENKVNDLPSMCCFMHSLFHLECNFFSLKSQSLLPRSVTTFRKNRPMKLKTNSDLELNCK